MTENRPKVHYIREAKKKFALFKTGLLNRPTWCSWQLTDLCNFRCDFCSAWKKTIGGEQTLSQIKQSAAQLARMGTMMVSMTGGEPLMRKDLPDVIRAINRYHFTFVSTNGSLVTPAMARTLAQSGLWGIGVSLDYADAKRHDAARGREGAFDQAVEALHILTANRIGNRPVVNIMITLMDDNVEDIPKLAELASGLGCSFRVQPYSTLKTGDTRRIYPEPVSKILLDLHRRYPNFVTSPVVLEKFDLALTTGVPGCVAGKYMVNIDPRGQVAICPERQNDPVGHILKDDPQTLLHRLKSKNRTNTCKACWYNCRNEIEMSYTFRGMYQNGKRYFLKRKPLQ